MPLAATTTAWSSSTSSSSSSLYHSFKSLRQRIIMQEHGPTFLEQLFFCIAIVLALELLNWLVVSSGRWFHAKSIPVRGKHLDQFTWKDYTFIGLNKFATGPFVICYLRYVYYYEPNVVWWQWNHPQFRLTTVLLPIPILFIVYDFFYTILHWALHIKSIYGYIHKHHHVQKAPSRANVDAVNVHPIEFFLGEYNHLLALFLTCRILQCQVHIVAALLFLALGGALAGWNHTRYDVMLRIPYPWSSSRSSSSSTSLVVFESKVHDVHHRFPQYNFGQYIMLWDILFGTFRPYDEDDRVNPKAQLDPTTGKSIAFMEEEKMKHSQQQQEQQQDKKLM